MSEGWLHKVQYYETDQMGIVHHSNYIRWFEEARTQFLDEIGYPFKRLEEEGLICPVISVSCEYKTMCHYEDYIRIIPRVRFFNSVKLYFEYDVIDDKTKEIRATGESGHCFLNEVGFPISLKKHKPELNGVLRSCLENK